MASQHCEGQIRQCISNRVGRKCSEVSSYSDEWLLF